MGGGIGADAGTKKSRDAWFNGADSRKIKRGLARSVGL